MYENEFNGALQAIAESVTESDFDAIVEGAAILLEENEGMRMDEAVQASAAMLYNEDAIGDESFAVTDAVIDEFASNVPAPWDQTLAVIAESVDEDTFDALMDEAVKDMAKKVAGAVTGGVKKTAATVKTGAKNADGAVKGWASDPLGKAASAEAKDAKERAARAEQNAATNLLKGAGSNSKYVNQQLTAKNNATNAARSAQRTSTGRKLATAGLGVATLGTVAAGGIAAKKAIDAAKEKKALKAAEDAKLSNKVKAKLEEGKEKAGEVVDKAKAKLAPKNEDASEMFSLKDLRALAEAVQTAEEQ